MPSEIITSIKRYVAGRGSSNPRVFCQMTTTEVVIFNTRNYLQEGEDMNDINGKVITEDWVLDKNEFFRQYIQFSNKEFNLHSENNL